MCSIEAIYLYNCNTYFKQYASKLATSVRIFAHIKGAKRVIMVDSIHRLNEFIEQQELRLPSATLEFEGGGKVGRGKRGRERGVGKVGGERV